MFDRLLELIELMAYENTDSSYTTALAAEVGRIRTLYENTRNQLLQKMQDIDRLKYELENAGQQVKMLTAQVNKQKEAEKDILCLYDSLNNMLLEAMLKKSTHPQNQKRTSASQ